jgi:hypothetical protein
MSADTRGEGNGQDRVTIGDTRPRAVPDLAQTAATAAPDQAPVESATASVPAGSVQTGADGSQLQLPLFYRRIEALNADRHADLGMVTPGSYAFAATSNAVPLSALEFPLAGKHYPIVFTATDPPTPVAVLGLQPGRNLFLDDGGAWISNTYVPAYVRRYPFILTTSQDGQKHALCVDMASALVARGATRPFFAAGEPTEMTQNALKFCQSHHQQQEATRAFAVAIGEQDLLGDPNIEIKLPDERRVSLRGFRAIDEKKFNALPDELFLDWRRRGILALVYCHLISLTNWNTLLIRAARAGGKVGGTG